MTILEQRFMEVVVRQLPLLVQEIREIKELLKQKNNGTDS
jgi:hypothetical protein